MIDLLDIKIQLQHKPFGNERIKLNSNSPMSSAISKRFSTTVALQPNGSLINVTSMDNGAVIQIRDSPLTPLQGHNVFGTNDVCLLGSALICAVLDQLNIAYTDAQRAAWKGGEFDIDALDITQRFALPENVSQKQLFQHMRINSAWAFRPAVISKGTGIRMAAPNSNAAWLFYDKRQQLDDGRTRSRKNLQAVAGEDQPHIWSSLQAAAGSSIRAELKLSKDYLKSRRLDRGSAWTIERVHHVYREEMQKLRFDSHVPLRQLRHSIDRVKNRALRQTLELWMREADLGALCKKSTLDRHRTQIRRLTGIDILHDVPMVDALPLADIFARGNMRTAFPRWAYWFPVYAFGVQPERYIAQGTSSASSVSESASVREPVAAA